MEPLDLSQLLHLVEEMPSYRQLIDELRESKGNTKMMVLDAAKPYLIAALYQSLQRPMMVVTAQPESCKKLYEQILTWCDSEQVMLFPELCLMNVLPQTPPLSWKGSRCCQLWLR